MSTMDLGGACASEIGPMLKALVALSVSGLYVYLWGLPKEYVVLARQSALAPAVSSVCRIISMI